MNGYQRIQAALKGEKTDKIPIMLHNFMMAAKEHGTSMEQYRNNPKVIAEVFIQAIEKYEYDGILVDIDTATLAGAVGVAVDFPKNDPARTHQGCLENFEDLKKLKPATIENYKYVQIWLEAVSLLKSYFKKEICIRGNCDQAPFSLASMMRGAQNWMLDLLMTPENQLLELLDYCADASGQFIRLMAEAGADMLSNGDSPAGPEMVAPETYVQYALPFEKKLVDLSHKYKLPYVLHICGNTDLILDQMLLSGADAIELDYKTDIQKVFNTFQNKATFMGNIDPSGVLATGSIEKVKQKTNELLKVYGHSPRFILNAGCAIPPDTPEENLKAMIKTAREFR